MASTNPDPATRSARGRAPVSETPSAVYPEESTAPSAGQGTAPATGQAPAAATQQSAQRTRAASFWVSVVVTALIFIALIIFLAQNGREISIHFLAWKGHISQAVALLIAAVCGALLVAIPASVRVVQLRLGLRRTSRRQ